MPTNKLRKVTRPRERDKLHSTVALLAIAVYLALFAWAALPSLSGDGEVIRRYHVLQLVLLPEVLFDAWFGNPPRLALLDRLPIFATAGLMLGTAWALGRVLLSLLRLGQQTNRWEHAALATALGAAVLSQVVFYLGWAGWLDRQSVFILMPAVVWLALLAMEHRRFARIFTLRKRQPASLATPPAEPSPEGVFSGPAWLVWLLAFSFPVLLGGMLPPIEFDVLEYHLQAPKEFYQSGRIEFLPHNVYGNMPLGAEMFALWGMALSGDWWHGGLAGKTVTAVFALLTALGLYGAGRRTGGPCRAWAAAVLFLSVPWVVQVSTLGLVDVVLGAYLFFAVWLLLEPSVTNAGSQTASQPLGWRRALAVGLLAGGAAACKYTGLIFAVLPLAAWIAWRHRRRPTTAARSLAAFAGGVLLAGAGWYLKNAVTAGNPLYPLLYDLLGGAAWSAEQNARWVRVHRPHDFSLPTLAADVWGVLLGSEWLSPLLIPAALLGGIAAYRNRRLRPLVWMIIYLLAVWWLFTHRIDRFWLPCVPLAALLGAFGVCRLADHHPRVVPWGTAFLLAATWIVATSSGGGDNRYFVPLDELRTARMAPGVRAINRLADDLAPSQAAVLSVGDAAVFDVEIPVVYATCFNRQPWEAIARQRTPQEIAEELARRRIRLVYVNWAEIARYRSPGNYGFSDFVQPEQFDRLEQAGVLRRIPLPEEQAGGPIALYRVVPPRERWSSLPHRVQ